MMKRSRKRDVSSSSDSSSSDDGEPPRKVCTPGTKPAVESKQKVSKASDTGDKKVRKKSSNPPAISSSEEETLETSRSDKKTKVKSKQTSSSIQDAESECSGQNIARKSSKSKPVKKLGKSTSEPAKTKVIPKNPAAAKRTAKNPSCSNPASSSDSSDSESGGSGQEEALSLEIGAENSGKSKAVRKSIGKSSTEKVKTRKPNKSSLKPGQRLYTYTAEERNRSARVCQRRKGPISEDWVKRTRTRDIRVIARGKANDYDNIKRTRTGIYSFINKYRYPAKKGKKPKKFVLMDIDISGLPDDENEPLSDTTEEEGEDEPDANSDPKTIKQLTHENRNLNQMVSAYKKQVAELKQELSLYKNDVDISVVAKTDTGADSDSTTDNIDDNNNKSVSDDEGTNYDITAPSTSQSLKLKVKKSKRQQTKKKTKNDENSNVAKDDASIHADDETVEPAAEVSQFIPSKRRSGKASPRTSNVKKRKRSESDDRDLTATDDSSTSDRESDKKSSPKRARKPSSKKTVTFDTDSEDNDMGDENMVPINDLLEKMETSSETGSASSLQGLEKDSPPSGETDPVPHSSSTCHSEPESSSQFIPHLSPQSNTSSGGGNAKIGDNISEDNSQSLSPSERDLVIDENSYYGTESPNREQLLTKDELAEHGLLIPTAAKDGSSIAEGEREPTIAGLPTAIVEKYLSSEHARLDSSEEAEVLSEPIFQDLDLCEVDGNLSNIDPSPLGSSEREVEVVNSPTTDPLRTDDENADNDEHLPTESNQTSEDTLADLPYADEEAEIPVLQVRHLQIQYDKMPLPKDKATSGSTKLQSRKKNKSEPVTIPVKKPTLKTAPQKPKQKYGLRKSKKGSTPQEQRFVARYSKKQRKEEERKEKDKQPEQDFSAGKMASFKIPKVKITCCQGLCKSDNS